MFLTRIPVPNFTPYNPAWLQQAPRYFTYVGAIIGALSAGVIFLTNIDFNPFLIATANIICSVLITGAFHEDGFADMCDAFGGGYTIEKKLTIMKDSRLGTYGALGLFLIIALKIFLIAEIIVAISNTKTTIHFSNNNLYIIALLSFVHCFSRFTPLILMNSLAYVSDLDASKSKPMATKKLGIASFIIALIPILLFGYLFFNYFIFYAFAAILMATIYMYWLCFKHLKGYTGDCLGASQQVSEILLYFALLIFLKFNIQ